LGPRRLVGVVVDLPLESPVPRATLQVIDSYADDLPQVPQDVLALARFAADYYQYPLGLALQHAVPPRGRQSAPLRAEQPAAYRLTAVGAGALGELPARARRQAQLAAALAGGLSIARAELLSSAPAAGPLLARWLASGWIERAIPEPNPEREGTVLLPDLNPAQAAAVRAIVAAAGSFQTFLLHGVTASGKTEVYLSAAAAAIARGEQVLMLVPEINLTPQLADRIRRALPFARIVQLHSNLPDAQRLAAWRQAAEGGAQFVLGTRLAVFAPLPRLGLVVVDEEHDMSYKQQDGLRYIARDLAVYRARLRGVPVVLGSATPAMETLWQARAGRYRLLPLPERAIAGAPPAIRLVPQRDKQTVGGIAAALRAALAANLARGEQSLLFINRRGYAPSLLCAACAWAAQCHRCSARLVLHLGEQCLRCHHCGHEEPVPRACPRCSDQDLLPLGFGTQRLEGVLRELFPAARIARVDADSTRRKGTWASLLQAILDRQLDILVGTQMMVKGHDFPGLTLVGVLGADNALYSADFRATERLFAQLTQVSGRAGRADLPGEVIIQTDFPAHPLYQSLLRHDYEAHAESLLAERRQLELPPCSRLALLRAEAAQRSAIERFLAAAHAQGQELARASRGVRVFPAVAARMARRAGFERAHILVQSAAMRPLQEFLGAWRAWLADNAPRNVRWALDVDPQELD
ncbi:MAG: primosomal protein N', partial [Burkholderiales bacterium]|nr:primosomal protein N' [Burkholderiales bacterium]